ncbi:MAG: SurA N-terminal domain-containing protein [Hyphomicrobiaceae bacterium]
MSLSRSHTVLLLCAGAALAASAAFAQGPPQIPGIVVTIPPSHPPPAPAPPAPPPAPAAPIPQRPPPAQAAPPAAKPKAAPKEASKAAAKPAPKPAAKSASKSPPGGLGTAAGLKESVNIFVNDDPVPITAYEIDQRARLLAMQADIGDRAKETFQKLVQSENTTKQVRVILEDTIRANQGKTREQILAIFEERKKQYALSLQKQAVDSARAAAFPALKKTALDELIDERLKLQEAKRMNLAPNDAEVDRVIKNLAQRNDMTEAQFAQHLKSQGVEVEYMKSRMRASMVWEDAVKMRFRASVSVSQRDIDRHAATSKDSAEEAVELQLRRITLALPAKTDQATTARRVKEAEELRQQFKDCNGMPALAAKAQNAKFQNLGAQKAAALPETMRGQFLAAASGQMLAPIAGKGGIELYAVCGRTVVSGEDHKKAKAQQDLMQKEFERRATALLRDLRNDAQIDYR